jgi:hypothetical protein
MFLKLEISNFPVAPELNYFGNFATISIRTQSFFSGRRNAFLANSPGENLKPGTMVTRDVMSWSHSTVHRLMIFFLSDSLDRR